MDFNAGNNILKLNFPTMSNGLGEKCENKQYFRRLLFTLSLKNN